MPADIKTKRLQRGWTQEDLARQVTTLGAPATQTTIARVEQGIQVPRPGLMKALMDVLGLQLTDFGRGKA